MGWQEHLGIVMELANGGNLFDLVRERCAAPSWTPMKRSRTVAATCCRGYTALSAQYVMCRNVQGRFERKGRAVVLQTGASRATALLDAWCTSLVQRRLQPVCTWRTSFPARMAEVAKTLAAMLSLNCETCVLQNIRRLT
jgi:hypothetical protein